MNSKDFERFCVVMFVIILIILAVIMFVMTVELNKTRDYRQYNEAELDSAVFYLGLEICQIVEGNPYFYYGDQKYNVIEFYKEIR